MPCCACCTQRKIIVGGWVCVVFGLAAMAVATWLAPYIDKRVDDAVTDLVTLTPEDQQQNTDAFRLWSDYSQPDAPPCYYKLYMFNCTNPEQVLQGQKPIIAQLGPYVYREYKVRFDITFDQDEQLRQRMHFKNWKYYVFERSLTDPSLDPDRDMIISPRPAFQVLKLDSALFTNNTVWTDYLRLFDKRSPNDLMFGYTDPILGFQFPGYTANTTTRQAAAATPPDCMYTGQAPYQSLLRQYYQWQGQEYMTNALGIPIWPASRANRVFGTLGTQFRRYLKQGEALSTFVTDLSREVTLVNANETVEVEGIKLLRFRLAPTTLLNSTAYPSNVDFKLKVKGMLDISSTIPTFPEFFMSKPAFLDTDYDLTTAKLTGMPQPSVDAHDTTIDVEPFSGATMKAQKRLQLSIYLHPIVSLSPFFIWFPNMQSFYYPVFWVEESGQVSHSDAQTFLNQVIGFQTLAYYLKWVGFIGGGCLVLLGVALATIVANKCAPHEDSESQELNQKFIAAQDDQ